MTTLEVTIPSAISTAARAALGRLPASGLVQGSPADRERARFGGLLDRSIMEGIVAGQRSYQETIKAAAAGGAEGRCSPGSPTRCSRACRRARTAASSAPVDVVVGRGGLETDPGVRARPGAYLQTGLIQAFAAHHLVHAAAAQGRLRVAVRGLRPPGAARSARGLRLRAGSRSASQLGVAELLELGRPRP